ncbi:MAG: carboxypeptidase-like regulatory domain-containing protein [Planctomycetes bacterium]|nr:carboxypeptidase-like regulatory domain-containing protein [Planctomycetota bacterium]
MKTDWMRLSVVAMITCVGLLSPVAPVHAEESAANIGGVHDGKGGSITGTVKFSGDQKKPKINRDIVNDAYCGKQHKDPVLDETFVWGDNGTLQNVLVYVSKGLEGKTLPAPEAKAELDQIGCVYVPHVVGVVVNQPLTILSNDETLHNVQANCKSNTPFNEGMPAKGMKLSKKFTKPELGMVFKCNVHGWMTAYVHVMSNQFFAVTQKAGTFEIKGLPPGEYELSVWHELKAFQPDHQTITVKVEEGKASDVTFTYSPPAKK